MLDNPNEPVSDLSYFDCIESVMENSKVGLLNQTAQEPFTHTELDILSIPPFLHLSLFCWTAPLLDTGPGRVHGRYFSELQDWRCACFWRLRRIGLKSSVWPHWSCRTGTGCLTAKELTSGSYCLYVTDDGRCFFFFFVSPQASYLVGVSDPNSQAGHQGLVDPIQFAKANQAIQMACQNLVDPDSSPSQVHALIMCSAWQLCKKLCVRILHTWMLNLKDCTV